MSLYGQAQIINKKVFGKKLLYLTVSSSMKKWIDFQQLTQYLPQIIEYEKKQNSVYNDTKEKFIQQKLSQRKQIVQNQDDLKSQIRCLEFVDIIGYDHQKREKIILFKVFFLNGKSQYMTNAEIKALNVYALVKFYENQIKSLK